MTTKLAPLAIGDEVTCFIIIPDDNDNLIEYKCYGEVIGLLKYLPNETYETPLLPFSDEALKETSSIVYVLIKKGLPDDELPIPTVQAFLDVEIILEKTAPGRYVPGILRNKTVFGDYIKNRLKSFFKLIPMYYTKQAIRE